jgi:hypothetical protein
VWGGGGGEDAAEEERAAEDRGRHGSAWLAGGGRNEPTKREIGDGDGDDERENRER